MKNLFENLSSLEELKELSISIQGAVRIFWPQYMRKEILVPRIKEEHHKKYSMNNGVIAWIDEKTLYVTPYHKRVLELLEENGYSKGYLYVPFSNWDYPTAEEERWAKLKEMAQKVE